MSGEAQRMVTTGTQLTTLEEYCSLPEGRPFYEFEEGRLIPMTSPTPEHQDILVELGHVLWRFVRGQRLGRLFVEADLFLPDGRAYIPDLMFVSTERMELLSPSDRKIHGVPDLVVEITSSEPERDRVHKFRVYYENGVPWYWIIDSQTLAIEEYQTTPDGYLRVASVAAGEEFRPQQLPGLTVNLAALVGDTA
jgi:Uma2 family endonuclease